MNPAERETEAREHASSGIGPLDELLQELRLGDNVVWQVEDLKDYAFFALPFVERALARGRQCVYVRFAPHPPVLPDLEGLATIRIDPAPGFDIFSQEVQRTIEQRGRKVFYVFDSLSALAEEWATDELLANFFKVTCPFLFDLDTIAYFALARGRHAHSAVARIRDTTQLLLDSYRVQGRFYIHPLKVWDRYSPQMFLPHLIEGDSWSPVFQSFDGALVSSEARRNPLSPAANSIAPWESVHRRLLRYQDASGLSSEMIPEIAALKEELSHMMMGSHPDFSRIIESCFTVKDLLNVRNRLIGSGRIGGKAAGMLAARCVLDKSRGPVDFSRVLESHDSFFIGSDVFFTFLVNNNLFRLRLQLSRSFQITQQEFEEVERRFLEGSFPPEIVEQFRSMLDYYGEAPIIVRSSSLLEDSFGGAFAGKYRSEFLANQGSPDDRIEALLKAVKLIYASALNPDAILYRRKRGLGEHEEQMAILVMRVSGVPYKHYFFPSMAGVAFSRNLYAWNDRIDSSKGLIRLVFGLGTRAVNRVGGDYPRMIAVSNPTLRPETGLKVAKYSQREMDLLDLERNEMVTLPITQLLEGGDYPSMHLLVSVLKEGQLYDPFSSIVEAPGRDLFLTFNNVIAKSDFVNIMGQMLQTLERAYGQPVDTEFTARVDESGHVTINLLQCRPLRVPGITAALALPRGLSPERILFRSTRFISGGQVSRIRYIIHIDPRRYAAMKDMNLKRTMGRLVGTVNSHPKIAGDRVLMIGPGRWGTSNIALGVNVSYADINNASVLVEVAREEAGHLPEVSYGTHFFQDLVEQQIIYLPVFPDDREAAFNLEFFESADNILPMLVEDAGDFADVLKVIDVPASSGGCHAAVIADPASHEAVCFLE